MRLEAADPTAARLVELRYFGGLTVDETAAVMGIGRTSAVQIWKYARAWLKKALAEADKASVLRPASGS